MEVRFYIDPVSVLTSGGTKKTPKKETLMEQSEFPEGWNEERIAAVLASYEQRSESDAAAEDDAAMEPSETLMSVPHELVSQIRELIARNNR